MPVEFDILALIATLGFVMTGMNALSAHVVILDQAKSQMILKEIESILENKFEISRSTIQIETYH